MKIKSIQQLKNRLDRVTEGKEVQDDGNEIITARYDVYEEMVELSTDSGTVINLTATEAKRLQSVLRDLL